jgi:hypothetical protein
MSPCAWYDPGEGEWVMLIAKYNSGSDKHLRRYTADNPLGTWTEGSAVTVSPAWASTGIWHFEAFPLGAQIVGLAASEGNAGEDNELFLMVSDDAGRTFRRQASALNITGEMYKCGMVPILTERGLGFDVTFGYFAPWDSKRGLIVPSTGA